MKKLSITLCAAAIMCSIMSVQAEVVPTPNTQPTETIAQCPQQVCDKCKKTECECPKTPVVNTCDELQAWKIKFFENRCKIYTQLALTQEQRVKAKCIDEKYFDEIAPLKICCKQEKAKLKEMQCKKNCKNDIKAQKEKIKDLKAEIKDKKKNHEKCFLEILNDCQKSSYKKLAKFKCEC